MAFRKLQRPNAAISARTIDQGVQARAILDKLSVAPPLELGWNNGSIIIRLAASIIGIRPAITTGTVAGGSYSSPVSATVTLLKWTGSAMSASGMPNVTALNCFSNATAIASGKLVWLLRLWGHWFIIAADCS